MSVRTNIELQDNFSSVLNGIVNSVNLAISSMYDIQQAMNVDLDTASLDAAREQINQATIAANELNAALANMGQAPVQQKWKTQSNMQTFDNSGMQRMNQEMDALTSASEEVFQAQRRIDEQALNMDVLPPEATWDINYTSQRVTELANRLNGLQGQDVSLLNDDSAELMNGQYESIRANMNQIVNLQAQMNDAIAAGDTSGLNEAYNQLNSTITRVEQQARTAQQTLSSLTDIQWNTSGDMEVFQDSGAERFRQEIQSANAMLGQLNDVQRAIWQTAGGMDVLPDSAVADIGSVGLRIQGIQMRIQQIESNPMNLGTDVANAQLEQLRAQLNRAVQEQTNLNTALNNMDVSGANAAYLRLSQTVSTTERYLRDNVDEQGQFNQAVQQGTDQANGLEGMIKKVAAAYLSIHTVGNILNISDQLTQTTARIDLMNDGMQTTQELSDMIYASAQNARGSYTDMAALVARFGNNAGDAFGSSEEVVQFANLVQKQMTIAGASTSEASNSMLQLSQALGSGVLRGDELNSIFEQAPNLIQNIADYVGEPIGKIREMAKEGELTADIVKNAIFAASDEINQDFESMPATWGQTWQSMKDTAIRAFQPVLERINALANSEGFQSFVDNAVEMIAVLSNVIFDVFETAGDIGSFIADNWSVIAPVVYGVVAALAVYYGWQMAVNTMGTISKGIHFAMAAAQMMHAAMTKRLTGATAAQIASQNGLNAAMYACPIVWIIAAVIALIAIVYAIVAAINKATNSTISATGIICGVVMDLAAFILNSFAIPVQNIFASLANFIGNVCNNPIAAIKVLFYDMVLTVLGYIQNLAEGIETLLNKIPGIEVEITGSIDDLYDKVEKAQQEVKDESGWKEYVEKWDYIDYEGAFEYGYEIGEQIDETVGDIELSDFFGKTEIPDPEDYANEFDGSGLGDNLSGIADSTDSIDDKMDITEEDLKYLRDLAEQETVNRYTVAEVNIDQSGMKNVLNGTDDLDGFVSGLTDAVNEAVGRITEGVHD